MAYETRVLQVKITGDASSFNKSIDNVEESSKNASVSFGKMSLAVAAGNAIWDGAKMAVEGIVDAASGAIEAADEGQLAIAQTNAVLESTAGIAGVTADQVDDLAHKFMGLTKYDNETVRSAENMLLTFTNIHENVFPATTQAVLDMSTAMGQDLKSTAIQVGKALQDPVLGATALQRVGVRLTQSQKDLIKQMVGVGNVAGAQKVILKELQTEFGGSAEAAGKTFGGQLAILKNKLDEVKKGIGETIEKAIYPMLTAINNWFDGIGGIDEALKILGDTFNKFMEFLTPVFNGLVSIYKSVTDYLIPKFEELSNSIQDHLIPMLVGLWQSFAPIVATTIVFAIGAIVDTFRFLSDGVSFLIPVLGGAVTAFMAFNIVLNVTEMIKGASAAMVIFNAVLLANPIGLVIGVVAGLAAGLALLIGANNNSTTSTSGLAAAQRDLQQAMDANKKAVKDNASAQYQYDLAQKTLLQDQTDVNQALKDYGPKSIEYRTAIDKQKVDEGLLADAKQRVIDTGNTIVSTKKVVIAANDEIKESANRAAGGYSLWAQNIGTMNSALKTAGGSPQSANNWMGILTKQLNITPHARGTNYAPGGLSLVGEEGPELINLPRGSQVVPNDKIGGSSSTVNLTVNVGMYAGMPVEKREIALSMYRELVRAARSQGVNMPMIGAVGVQ